MAISSHSHLAPRERIKSKKYFGQHFLFDTTILGRIVDAAQLGISSHVIEIGTGLGSLTTLLARNAGHVVTVERDLQLLPKLHKTFAQIKNITLVPGNFLDIPLKELVATFPGKRKDFDVVGNIPYNITSPILQKLLTEKPTPASCVLMVQKEVADRICASPGDFSMLAMFVQWRAQADKLFDVGPEFFTPPPKVRSAVIRLVLKPTQDIALPKGVTEEDVFSLSSGAFKQKRKKLHNSLKATLRVSPDMLAKILKVAEISGDARPQELSIPQWISLARILKNTD